MTITKISVALIINKTIAIYSGPSGLAVYGQLQNLVSGVIGIVAAPSSTGLISLTSKFNKDIAERNIYWNVALQLSLAIAGILIPILIIFNKRITIELNLPLDYSWLVIAYACTLPVAIFSVYIPSILNGKGRIQQYVLSGVFSNFCALISFLILYYYFNIKGALFGIIIYSAIIGFINILIIYNCGYFRLKLIKSIKKHYYFNISKYIMMAVVSAASVNLSLLLIRNIVIINLGMDNAGIWQGVSRLSDAYLSVIFITFSVYLLPKLSQLDSIFEIKIELKNIFIKIIIILSIIAPLVVIARNILLEILYSKEFIVSKEFMIYQVIGDIFKSCSWLYSYPMLAKGIIRWFIGIEIIFSLSYVLISYFIIDAMGFNGITLAYMINQIVAFIVIRLLIDKILYEKK